MFCHQFVTLLKMNASMLTFHPAAVAPGEHGKLLQCHCFDWLIVFVVLMQIIYLYFFLGATVEKFATSQQHSFRGGCHCFSVCFSSIIAFFEWENKWGQMLWHNFSVKWDGLHTSDSRKSTRDSAKSVCKKGKRNRKQQKAEKILLLNMTIIQIRNKRLKKLNFYLNIPNQHLPINMAKECNKTLSCSEKQNRNNNNKQIYIFKFVSVILFGLWIG